MNPISNIISFHWKPHKYRKTQTQNAHDMMALDVATIHIIIIMTRYWKFYGSLPRTNPIKMKWKLGKWHEKWDGEMLVHIYQIKCAMKYEIIASYLIVLTNIFVGNSESLLKNLYISTLSILKKKFGISLHFPSNRRNKSFWNALKNSQFHYFIIQVMTAIRVE